jgi:hypothetical protein
MQAEFPGLAIRAKGLDDAVPHATKEVVRVSLGLGEDLRIVAILQAHFLHNEFDRVFRLETLGDQFPHALGKARWTGGLQPRKEIRAPVFFELRCSQPIESALCLWVTQQRGDWCIPLAI